MPGSTGDLLACWNSLGRLVRQKNRWKTVHACIWWTISKERNSRCFEDRCSSIHKIKMNCLLLFHFWCKMNSRCCRFTLRCNRILVRWTWTHEQGHTFAVFEIVNMAWHKFFTQPFEVVSFTLYYSINIVRIFLKLVTLIELHFLRPNSLATWEFFFPTLTKWNVKADGLFPHFTYPWTFSVRIGHST